VTSAGSRRRTKFSAAQAAAMARHACAAGVISSGAASQILRLLLRFTRPSDPFAPIMRKSTSWIARETGRDYSTVKRAIDRLVSAGLLVVVTPNSGRTAATYRVDLVRLASPRIGGEAPPIRDLAIGGVSPPLEGAFRPQYEHAYWKENLKNPFPREPSPVRHTPMLSTQQAEARRTPTTSPVDTAGLLLKVAVGGAARHLARSLSSQTASMTRSNAINAASSNSSTRTRSVPRTKRKRPKRHLDRTSCEKLSPKPKPKPKPRPRPRRRDHQHPYV
jgi:hypothetical protein